MGTSEMLEEVEYSCPHCGVGLTPDERIHAGPWRLSRWLAEYQGKKLELTAAEANVLHTLARANGDIVSPEVIGQNFGSRDKSNDTVRALVMRLRKKLGAHCPVATIRNHGYRWQVPTTPLSAVFEPPFSGDETARRAG